MSEIGTSDRGPVARSPAPWVLVTGEYPPQAGGVSDHSRILARGLAEAGDKVYVIAPAVAGQPLVGEDGQDIVVYRLAGGFGPRGLRGMMHLLAEVPAGARLLVQYVPQAFGMKGMNLPLCVVLARHRRHPLWVVFHEVFFPFERRRPVRHAVLALATRAMARILARAAECTFVTTTSWERLLTELAPGMLPPTWLPVPSNLPDSAPAELVRAIKLRVAGDAQAVVLGHFGTFDPVAPALVEEVFSLLLFHRPGRVGLVIGRGSQWAVDRMNARHPELVGRLHAADGLDASAAAAHLAACDLVVQPYPDGVTTRRGTTMAALALGIPVVTNGGPLTELLWAHEGAAVLANARGPIPEAFASVVDTLTADSAALGALGRRGRTLYRTFEPARMIQVLRERVTPEGVS